MAFQFVLPDIGEGIVEGEVVRWHVQVGDVVQEDQTLVEVMTDKATVQIPSPKAGKITRLACKEGEIAQVGKMLLEIETGDSAQPATTVSKSVDAPAAVTTTLQANRQALIASNGQKEILATPAVRKLAREEGIELESVKGTGADGRITREDVLNHAAQMHAAPAAPKSVPPQPVAVRAEAPPSHGAVQHNVQPQQPRPAAAPPKQSGSDPQQSRQPQSKPQQPVASAPQDERRPIRGLRKRIYDKMHQSKSTAAHFTYVEEFDLTELVELRERTKTQLEAQGVKLNYLPFIMKGCVVALKKFPHINALVDDSRGETIVRRNFNLGFAVQTDEGLMVPVVRDVDQKSIVQLAKEIDELAHKCRTRTASSQELSGGSFTITSLGQLGGVLATPVINYPEVAILGVHAIRPKPAVVNNQIVIRQMANFAASFDHRLIDGYVGAEFIAELKKYLQDPQLLFMQLV